MTAPDQIRTDAAVMAIVSAATVAEDRSWKWHEIAALLDEIGTVEPLADPGCMTGFESESASRLFDDARAMGALEKIDLYERLIREHIEGGTAVTTVLNETYPRNLRAVYDKPPFLFCRGNTDWTDRAVAVVGTRKASPAGIEMASELARSFAERSICVVSGMARGIDTAAHRAAIDAGGITYAVFGTGIDKTYPAENVELRQDIERHGTVISQFWPGTSPRPYNFPLRNVTTSGMSLGTVVIEASSTSGAKNQARRALEHGKWLFLIESLVLEQEWAHTYSSRPRVTVVKSADDVVQVIESLMQPAEQLTFT